MVTIDHTAREIAAKTGMSDYDAHQWTVENAVGGDMVPAGSGYDAEISDEDAAFLVDVAVNTDQDGVYHAPSEQV